MLAESAPIAGGESLPRSAQLWQGPLAAAAAYYCGAQAAFLIGTLSDEIYAPFWPPNAVLFCALLLTPVNRWWTVLAALFPAHVLAEIQVGMPPLQLVVAFATNCTVAILNAASLLWLSGGPPWFGSIRKAAIYILATAVVNPALAAFGGAFVPIMGGGSLSDFPYFWGTWYLGNALASLTLGPIILAWMAGRQDAPSTGAPRGLIEPLLIAFVLVIVCIVSLELSVIIADNAFRPAILYLPLPIILWGAVRFGEKGAAGAILILTVVSISLTLRGESPFVGDSPEKSVIALQVFLFGIAIPTIMLAAAVDQLRTTEGTTRKLVGSLVRAQDEERRRIARDLHDSTGQNLVAAYLLANKLAVEAPEASQREFEKIDDMLRQSILELQLAAYVLHPPQLEQHGLEVALSKYVAGFSERSGIDVQLHASPRFGRLPPDIEITLYRVVQEALTNVDRHARSRTASIRLARRWSRARGVVHLAVEDSGRGFPAGVSTRAPGHRRSGLGLDSMRERVSQIGGRLKIASAPGRTVVRIIVPVRE